MKQTLDHFILSIPTLFIKQYPYAWIVAIALWSWPLNISAALFLIVALGMVSLRWREAAWIAEMRRQHAPKGGTFYVDRLPVPAPRAVRNIAILTAVSAAAAFCSSRAMIGGFPGFWMEKFYLPRLTWTSFSASSLPPC